ncbi:tryptophan--tRNA ligase [archaeon]|jgi:tryptophanyl-tRNA synthetase|nr:tryptophan--tRNA ligase [archaeon]MBT6697729.1 tryptophan--tRNA ligase [archaeon]
MSKGKEAVVTPWEVKGNIDYGKLIEKFGVSKIDKKLLSRIAKVCGGEDKVHPFLRRGIFFAHRDLKWALDEYDKGNKFYLYTGCGPSGPVHLGHATIWQFTKWLQDVFDCELYFQFTDDEKFLFKDKSFDEIQKWVHENMLDVIAFGFDHKKTHFIVDTKHANIMYPQAIQVAKKLTTSTVKSAFGLKDSSNVGQMFYTAMQAVPAFLPSQLKGKNIPCLIPHAIDQDPHFRVTRDILPKLGYYKPASIQSRFLPGLGGIQKDGKLSSSTGAAIYMTDSAKDVKKKINKYAFSGGQATVEEHRRLGGNPDVDVSYQWLSFFEEDDSKLAAIYADYKSGKLLSGELKAILIEKVNGILAAHQKRRAKAESKISKFMLKV